MGKIQLLEKIQVNYSGYVVPGFITRVYDEQPDDADEAVDAHVFVPSDLNVPGNTVFLRGLRHAENKANPKAHGFIFLGEDEELIRSKSQSQPQPPENVEEQEVAVDPANASPDKGKRKFEVVPAIKQGGEEVDSDGESQTETSAATNTTQLTTDKGTSPSATVGKAPLPAGTEAVGAKDKAANKAARKAANKAKG